MYYVANTHTHTQIRYRPFPIFILRKGWKKQKLIEEQRPQQTQRHADNTFTYTKTYRQHNHNKYVAKRTENRSNRIIYVQQRQNPRFHLGLCSVHHKAYILLLGGAVENCTNHVAHIVISIVEVRGNKSIIVSYENEADTWKIRSDTVFVSLALRGNLILGCNHWTIKEM